MRELEARVDARFRGVNARFSTVDRRYDSMRSRHDTVEGQWHDFAEQVEQHHNAVDGRFDATDRRIDVVFDSMSARVDKAVRQQGRTLIYVVIGLVTVDVAAVVVGVLLS